MVRADRNGHQLSERIPHMQSRPGHIGPDTLECVPLFRDQLRYRFRHRQLGIQFGRAEELDVGEAVHLQLLLVNAHAHDHRGDAGTGERCRVPVRRRRLPRWRSHIRHHCR